MPSHGRKRMRTVLARNQYYEYILCIYVEVVRIWGGTDCDIFEFVDHFQSIFIPTIRVLNRALLIRSEFQTVFVEISLTELRSESGGGRYIWK